jgi:hypothetical protein
VTLGLTLGIAAACGMSRLPSPTYSAQPSSALEAVPFPPPPARVEIVPDKPRTAGAVWIDGEWTWAGKRWSWRRGRWIVPPRGATFSPWTAVRDKTGLLYVASGTWRDAQGQEIEEPAPIALAKSNAGAVVNPEGEAVKAGPNVREESDGGARDDEGGVPDASDDVGLPPSAMPLAEAGAP